MDIQEALKAVATAKKGMTAQLKNAVSIYSAIAAVSNTTASTEMASLTSRLLDAKQRFITAANDFAGAIDVLANTNTSAVTETTQPNGEDRADNQDA